MNYIPPEIIKEAQKVDLLSYLKEYDPNELVYLCNNTYCTKTHDSLKISNGLWNWFSKGIGGKNAIDYLIKFKNYSFVEAIEMIIKDRKITSIASESKEIKNNNKVISIPEKDESFEDVKVYLINRGIDEIIINECYKNNLIYQEKNTKNVVFLGYDSANNIKYAGIRATNETRFMRDSLGSDKAYSFRLISKNNSNRVHVFESAIDLLSYATILKINGKDFKNENLISLSGVYQPAKIIEQSKIPIAIKTFLESNNNIQNVILHFDNDIAGRNATKAFQIVVSKKYNVIDAPVPMGKDVNDYLCFKLGLKKIKNNLER